MFMCPKCSLPMRAGYKCYKCVAGHNYDVSASGYVNLLLGTKASHGDSKEMILARRRFLKLGHYYPVVKKLKEIIWSNGKFKFNMLDAGCGEGYYLSEIMALFFRDGRYPSAYGIDVSKEAVALAAKTNCGEFAVASINALPFDNQSFDVILSLFAPLNEKEFYRVLKPGGMLITVSPSENHLFGLKQAVYEVPYKNPPSTFENKLLTKTDDQVLEYKIRLDTRESISDLFKMTPYYHKSSSADIEKALSLTELETEIGFNIITYTKI